MDAGATKPDKATTKGRIVEFTWWMQKQEYKESTYKSRTTWIETLVKLGVNLWDPESIKEILAKNSKWGDGYKANLIDSYSCFLEMEGLTWNPPKYRRPQRLPFIPTEAEIDQLISSCGKVVGTFLQGLKDTGADPGELVRLRWIDINKEAKTVSINHPVKGHNPRVMPVSEEFLRRLSTLKRKSERVFPTRSMYQNYRHQRRKATRKFGNPRLLKINFTTLRHWKGTMEYHQTKDILHVKKILGHKCIQSTMIYINLEAALFKPVNDEFTVGVANNLEEACELLEAGF